MGRGSSSERIRFIGYSGKKWFCDPDPKEVTKVWKIEFGGWGRERILRKSYEMINDIIFVKMLYPFTERLYITLHYILLYVFIKLNFSGKISTFLYHWFPPLHQ